MVGSCFWGRRHWSWGERVAAYRLWQSWSLHGGEAGSGAMVVGAGCVVLFLGTSAWSWGERAAAYRLWQSWSLHGGEAGGGGMVVSAGRGWGRRTVWWGREGDFGGNAEMVFLGEMI
ncbi:hypothetical protein SLA2020_288880 [Shorea laevis]